MRFRVNPHSIVAWISRNSSLDWPIWRNDWVFVYELNSCGFESRCSHLNFRFCACFEQGVPWHSGNYRVWIVDPLWNGRTWHDKNIQSWNSSFETFKAFIFVFRLYDYFQATYIFICEIYSDKVCHKEV